MKKLCLLGLILMLLSCKSGEKLETVKEDLPVEGRKSATVKSTKSNNLGTIIEWGMGGQEALFATITVKMESGDTLYGFFLNEYGEADPEFYKIQSKEYGIVSEAYKNKKVEVSYKKPPHDYSIDKDDKSVIFTSVKRK